MNDEDSSSDELFTAESFVLVCKQAEDMEDMTIGDCLDYIQEFIDNQKKERGSRTNVRKASQSDFDNF